MWVAVDAMSGDLGHTPAVLGSVLAVREFGHKILLVGKEDLLKEALKLYPREKDSIKVIPAEEVIGMNESPSLAIRKKPNASVLVAARLVKEKEAIGFFSPGNTGATMAAALKELGRIPGVKRPAIATPIPRRDGKATVLLDAGANVDCKPEYLLQFAIMGEIYTREIIGILNPRIGILSNGEEEKKGNHLTQEVYRRLKKLPYEFVGYVEGRDLFGYGKRVDVVLCDGFVGNVVLKTAEGCARAIFEILKENIKASRLAKAGAFLLKPALYSVKHRMDYTTYGGAPLLGVQGICMIGHGSSNAIAFKNAIHVTYNFQKYAIGKKIEENIHRFFTPWLSLFR